MINPLQSLHSLLYPGKCILCGDVIADSSPFCNDCFMLWSTMHDEGCVSCGCEANKCDCIKIQYVNRVVFAFWYGEEPLRKLIYRLKYMPCKKTATFFSSIMATEIRRRLAGKRGGLPFEVITFVPRSKKAYNKYGHDQALMIAKQLSKFLQLPCINLLERTHSSPQQKSLGLNIRLQNIRGLFHAKDISPQYKRVLLVDDVTTTGATFSSAAQALKLGGVREVYCVAAAKTNKSFIKVNY